MPDRRSLSAVGRLDHAKATHCAACPARQLRGVGAIPGGGFCGPTPATVGFSFSNLTGDIDRTVEGLIELPDGDGTELRATGVELTAYPAALGYDDPPTDAFARIQENAFTVADGEIASTLFRSLLTPSSSDFQIDWPRATFDGTDLSLRDDIVPTSGVVDRNGATLVFTAVEGDTAAVPLPAAGWLLLAGLGRAQAGSRTA